MARITILAYDFARDIAELVEIEHPGTGLTTHQCGHVLRSQTARRFATEICPTHCPGCCTCVVCRVHRHRCENVCSACGACTVHCECVICTQCQHPAVTVCAAHTLCSRNPHHNRCCSYASTHLGADRVILVDRPVVFFPGPIHHQLRSTRYVAVELECARLGRVSEALSINTLLRDWGCGVVYDGSIDRDPDTNERTGHSFEINTSPSQGSAFVKQLTDICSVLRAGDTRVDTRCGTHVHVDARDYDLAAVERLALLYRHLEYGLFQLLPEDRRSNIFCRPTAPTLNAILRRSRRTRTDLPTRISMELYGTPDATRARLEKGIGDYGKRRNALNLHSWMYRKTFEFRHHPGSIDPNEILGWVALLTSLVDRAAKGRYNEFLALDPNPVTALRVFAGQSNNDYLLDYVDKTLATHSPNAEGAWVQAHNSNLDLIRWMRVNPQVGMALFYGDTVECPISTGWKPIHHRRRVVYDYRYGMGIPHYKLRGHPCTHRSPQTCTCGACIPVTATDRLVPLPPGLGPARLPPSLGLFSNSDPEPEGYGPDDMGPEF